MGDRNHPPDERKAAPRNDGGGEEEDKVQAPLHVDEGGEDIREVAPTALEHVPTDYVTVSILLDESIII